MTAGTKQKYTRGQKRKAKHILESYEEKGVPHDKAEEIAWATVNKQSGGGELGGSGSTTPESEKKAARKDSAKNAAKTKEAQTDSNALEQQSIDTLRKKAREKHVRGRSSMNKAELILALRRF
jgi:hypothetical protein